MSKCLSPGKFVPSVLLMVPECRELPDSGSAKRERQKNIFQHSKKVVHLAW